MYAGSNVRVREEHLDGVEYLNASERRIKIVYLILSTNICGTQVKVFNIRRLHEAEHIRKTAK